MGGRSAALRPAGEIVDAVTLVCITSGHTLAGVAARLAVKQSTALPFGDEGGVLGLAPGEAVMEIKFEFGMLNGSTGTKAAS
jgi:hypothetical protein